MKNELIVNGTQEFMGVEIPVIEGGFGDNQRCVSDKHVAEIHGMQNKHVREAINKNKQRFKESVDFVDLKKCVEIEKNKDFLITIGYAKASITQSNNIYILSETGYSIFLNIIDNPLDSQFKEFYESYFNKQNYFIHPLKRKEHLFFERLHPILSEIGCNLEKQYISKTYRIDGYIPEFKIAIEFDENNHKYYDKEKEEIRESDIKEMEKCAFIRIDSRDCEYSSIGKIINKIIQNSCKQYEEEIKLLNESLKDKDKKLLILKNLMTKEDSLKDELLDITKEVADKAIVEHKKIKEVLNQHLNNQEIKYMVENEPCTNIKN